MNEEISLDSPRQMAEAVAPIFSRYGWTYWDSPEPPPPWRIEEVIRDLIKSASEREYGCSSTGRIQVERDDESPQMFEVFLSLGHYEQIPAQKE